MSLGFYPRKGLVCFGSEQAALMAALKTPFPGLDLDCSMGEIDDNTLRLDLDDMGGEAIVLVLFLDWGCRRYMNGAVSNRPSTFANMNL